MPLCICAVAGVARFTGTNGAGASPSRNGCRCSSVGGASDLRRVGTANSMLSPRTGTAVFREAGSPADTAAAGNGRRGASGQRAFGASPVGVSIAVNRQFSIIRVRIDRGGRGRGWRTYSRLRPWRATGCWRRHAEPPGGRGSRRGGFPSGESRGASRGSECAPNRAVCVEVRSRSFWIRHPSADARCSPGPQCEPRNPKAGVHTHSRRDVRSCGRVTPPRGARFAPHFEFRAR
jgi:hypothetical protein